MHVWDASTGTSVRQLPERWVQALAFLPDGRLLAVAAAFKVIRVFEVASGKAVAALKGHKATISGLAFVPTTTR